MAKLKKTKRKFRNAGSKKSFFTAPTGWLGSGVASLVGGGGGALLGGIVASQDIVKPETAGLLMAVGGMVGGVFGEGHTRTAMHGLAGAGAGQLALAYMATRSTPKSEPAPARIAAAPPPALPAPAPNGQSTGPVSMPSNAYGGGGHVWSAFRDAAGELEMFDDDSARDEYVDAAGWEDAA